MTYTEEWFCLESRNALRDLYKTAEDLDGVIVEVGCWQGRSTVALAKAAKPETVRAVDTWQGSPGEISAELAAGRDVFAEFQHNTAGLNIEPYRMDWRTYFAEHRDPIKFLHIDAAHSYKEVRENIEAALPLMVPGAVICGDDAHHPPVQKAVIHTLGDAQLLATLWWRQL